MSMARSGDATSAKTIAAQQARTAARSHVQSIEDFLGLPQPHTPSQELQHFGSWVGESIWVPPKDNNEELANSMLNQCGVLSSKEKSWKSVVREHRAEFSEVRRMKLPAKSIRLPQGELYVTVTQQKDFHTIEEQIPASVQTRLDEFLAGPGRKHGVKVYYLKPLCVEVGSDLIFTTETELEQAICKIKTAVLRLYRQKFLRHRARKFGVGGLDALLAIPRGMMKLALRRRKRAIETVHSKAEFERRKQALDAFQYRQQYRHDDCTFDEVLSLTNAPDRDQVIDHYVKENSPFSELDRQLYKMASGAMPWFLAFSVAAFRTVVVRVKKISSIRVCDPVFVAEMPGQRGKLLKIGHFDEIDGVMHVEI